MPRHAVPRCALFHPALVRFAVPRRRGAHSTRLTLAVALLALLAGAPGAGAEPGVWTPVGPGGGAVFDLAVDPTAPATLYAAAGNAGVYASLDGGESWVRRGGLPGGQGALSVAVDASTNTGAGAPVLYADTWLPRRVYASADGGASWRLLYEAPELYAFDGGLEVGADGTVYLLAQRLHVGHDRGSRWRVAPVGDPDAGDYVRQVIAHPSVPGRVVARTESGAWRSDDGGATWRRLATPGPVAAFAFAPSQAETVYLTVSHDASAASTYRSLDGGEHWELRSDLAWFEIVVDPFAPNVLYSFGRSIFRVSRDAGATWEPYSIVAPAIAELLADPSTPGRLWLADEEEGVLASDDHGATWRRAEAKGLTARLVVGLSFDDEGRAYALLAGYRPGRTLRRDGERWADLPSLPPSAPVTAVAARPHRPWIVYAAGLGVAASRDDGLTWRPLPGVEGWVNDLYLPARGPLVAAGYGIRWSDDGGESWQESLAPSVCRPDGCWDLYVTRLIADPERVTLLYAAVTYAFPGRPSGDPPPPLVLRSLDGGRSWRRFVAGTTVLAPAASQPRTLYAAFGEVVLASDDGGRAWRVAGVAGGGGVRDLAVDPLDPRTLYAATAGGGVRRSADGGATWEAFGRGLEAAGRSAVDRLWVDPAADRLYAAPRLGGLFELVR